MFAKHAYLETGIGGSNPPLSATKSPGSIDSGLFFSSRQSVEIEGCGFFFELLFHKVR